MKQFPSFHIYLIPLLAVSIGAGVFYAVSVSRREEGKNGSVISPEGPQCAHWAVFRTAQLFGIPTQPGDIQRLLPNNSDGHSLVQVIETLEKIGIKAEGYRDNWETLAAVSFPCIVHLTNPNHYIVVSGIERERGYVHIFDDAGNRTRQRRDVFEKRWSGYVLHVEKDAGFFVSKNQKDAPLAIYEHLILDKGDIPSVGEPTEFVYPVRNNGNENLVIEDIKVTCGCLKSEKPDEPIPPGGNGIIKLFYTVEPKRGVFAQSAAVKTNDPNNPIVVLTACGFTGVDVRVEPSRINLDRLFVEQESIYRCFDSAIASGEQIIRLKKTGKTDSNRAIIHYQLEGEATTGNRFIGTLLEDIPVPLPSNYLMGLDLQKKESERGVFSYLHGTWKIGGWWYFYLYAMLIKIPLGTWGIVILALIFTQTNKRFHSSWQNEVFLLLPVLVIIGNFSMQHSIGIHSRYVMPLLPFLFIWAGKTGIVFSVSKFGQKFFVSGFLIWSLGSSFYSFPHSISYCNEIAGGSENAYKHLAKSDSSWGQDLLLLHQWLQLHPEVTDLHLAHCGPFDPRIAGLNFTLPLVGLNGQEHGDELPMETLGPQPGWYAIDVNFLLGGDPLSAADGHGGWVEFSKLPGYDISYFQKFNPIARIGYSIYIYHLTQEDVRNYQKSRNVL